jgi:hypothetical protein
MLRGRLVNVTTVITHRHTVTPSFFPHEHPRCLSSVPLQQPLPRNIRNRNQKFDKNITKRGNVDPGKVAERKDDFPVSQTLILFFMIVLVGSTLVQIFNLFGGSASKPPVE